MAGNVKTYLYCYDDNRGLVEEIRKGFSDEARYRIESFPSREEFLVNLEKEKEHKYCKITILAVNESKDQTVVTEKFAEEIKNIDPGTGIILLAPPEKIEELRKSVRCNIDFYIAMNTNAILRIHNAAKRFKSEHSILIFRKRRNISLYILFAFLFLSALLILITYFRLPQYFR